MLVKGAVRLLWHNSRIGREFTFNMTDGENVCTIDMLVCFLTVTHMLHRRRGNSNYSIQINERYWLI